MRMARNYTKSYNNRSNKIGPHTNLLPVSSIQFDTLFCENSRPNRPSATKSAGTIGKWGITSFTSIRSTNLKLNYSSGRQDEKSYSKKRIFGNDSKGQKDTYALETPRSPPTDIPPRPKKFFKSRNTVETLPPPTPAPPQKKYSKPTPSPKLAVTAASKKAFPPPVAQYEEEQTEAMNLSATPSTPVPLSSPTTPAHNPPIVLRIFKGTSQLVTSVEESVPSLPPVKKESSRRKNHHHHHHSDTHGHISPKRLRERNRDSHEEPIPKLRVINSTTEPVLQIVPETTSQSVQPMVPETELKTEEEAATVDTNVSVETMEDISKQIEDLEQLKQAETLLANTYTDFSVKTKKLLDVKTTNVTESDRKKLLAVLAGDECDDETVKNSTLKINVDKSKLKQEIPDETMTEVEKPVERAETEWFSDSDSDSIAEQINTLADSQQAKEDEQNKKPRPKKGSFFKSRSEVAEKKKYKWSLYKHKWEGGEQGSATPTQTEIEPLADSNHTTFEEDFETEPLTRVTSYPEPDTDNEDAEAITSVKCTKKAKGYYTVVRNVKKAHQIQESGEFQEFNDDVEYILDALQDNNPIGTRCLSAISLATKCMAPAFRMHVRAHGTVAKFFRALHDATKDQSLGMCTATVMFVLSQDRLNMDLDRDCLELMLNLLESDTSHTSALDDCGLSDSQLRKTREKVRQLCEEIQSKGNARHLNLDNITVGHLAMETLLSLTSRRAGEWFKEELRELGGLEHIARTVVETSRVVRDSIYSWTPALLDKLRKVDRCLRVLENVTLQNEENSLYLLTYKDGEVVDTLIRLFSVCDAELYNYPVRSMTDRESTGYVIRECLVVNLKVLINLTHDFHNKSFGSSIMGSKPGVVESTLHVLLQAPDLVPEEQKFDLIVLALILLINLMEHSQQNRTILIKARAPPDPDSIFDASNSVSAVSALVAMFYQQEELARTEERKTDAILEGEPKKDSNVAAKSQEECIEETVTMLLQKAGRHMEHTLVGAYIALLLGYLIIDNKEYETFVRQQLPEGNFVTMLAVLNKFFNFMTLTAGAGSGSSRGIKATEMVIKYLTNSDRMLNET